MTRRLESSRPSPRNGALLVATVAVAFNLRPLISSLPPVLHDVRATLSLSGLQVDVLTAIPVLCLGALAPVAVRVEPRIGTTRLLAVASTAIAAGAACRAFGGFPGLIIGTFVGAAGIGVAGVLMPGFVRHRFAGRPATVTAIYTAALTGGATLAAGTTVPLAHWFGGWRGALMTWALPALIGALLVAKQGSRSEPSRATPTTPPAGWRASQAYRLGGLMALLSFSYYSVLTWLPTRYHDVGTDSTRAGVFLAVVNIAQVPAALALPLLTHRSRTHRTALTVSVALTVGGLLGIALAPTRLPYLWSAITGAGQGSGLALALTLIATTAPDLRETAALSWRAQAAGYTLGATGPFLIGLLHQWLGSWRWAFLGIAVATALQLPTAARLRGHDAAVVRPALPVP